MSAESPRYFIFLCPTCGTLVVDGEANDQLAVVLWRIPREQDGGAGLSRSLEMKRTARKPRPHNDGQFGSGTGGAQDIGGEALVIPGIFRSQLVDEENPGALSLHTRCPLQTLTVLQPQQRRSRRTRTVTHKPRRVPLRQRDRLRRFHYHRRG